MRQLDKKAVRIIKKWWLNKEGTSLTDIEYAKSKGVMFEPYYMTHDEMVSRITSIKHRLRKEAITDAFLFSLTTRRLDLRSAMGSWATMKCFSKHKQKPVSQCACEICGGWPTDGPFDLNGYSYTRHKFGGSSHWDRQYALFDLEQFEKLEFDEVPTDADIKILKSILEVASRLKAEERANSIRKEISALFPTSRQESEVLIELLGYMSILQPKNEASFFHEFIKTSRMIPRTERSDWSYPIDFWAGSDGVQWDHVEYWFPKYIDQLRNC